MTARVVYDVDVHGPDGVDVAWPSALLSPLQRLSTMVLAVVTSSKTSRFPMSLALVNGEPLFEVGGP